MVWIALSGMTGNQFTWSSSNTSEAEVSNSVVTLKSKPVSEMIIQTTEIASPSTSNAYWSKTLASSNNYQVGELATGNIHYFHISAFAYTLCVE